MTTELPQAFALKETIRRGLPGGHWDADPLFLQAPVFVVTGVRDRKGGELAAGTVLRLPFSPVLYEAAIDGKTWFILCLNVDDAVSIVAYTRTAEHGVRVYPFQVDYFAATNEFCFDSIFPPGQRPQVDQVPEENRLVASRFLFALAALCILACNQPCQTQVVPASRRPLLSRGKISHQGWEYRVVTLPAEHSASAGGEAKGTHASPRWHTRRGHWRHARLKLVWVRDCEVGSKERGGIVHDYQVAA